MNGAFRESSGQRVTANVKFQFAIGLCQMLIGTDWISKKDSMNLLFHTRYSLAKNPEDALREVAAGNGCETMSELEKKYTRLRSDGLFRDHAVYRVHVEYIG